MIEIQFFNDDKKMKADLSEFLDKGTTITTIELPPYGTGVY